MIVAGSFRRRRLNFEIFVAYYMKHYVQQKVNRKFVNSKHLHFLHKTIYHFCECEKTFYDNRAVFLIRFVSDVEVENAS